MGYPAHPWIVEKRTNVVNRTCFCYPQILKNEIEYLHMKLSENDKSKEHKFEKEF